MKLFDKDFKEIFTSQLISIAGGLLAGILLASYTDQLILVPGMFIILPGFLDMRGNISSAMAARLSSGLYLKVINPDDYKSKIVLGNLVASFLLVLVVTMLLGLLAFGLNAFVFGLIVPKIIFIPIIAGIIANSIEIIITLLGTFYLFKKGFDPNNIMGPLITSTGDVTSIISLLVAMIIL